MILEKEYEAKEWIRLYGTGLDASHAALRAAFYAGYESAEKKAAEDLAARTKYQLKGGFVWIYEEEE